MCFPEFRVCFHLSSLNLYRYNTASFEALLDEVNHVEYDKNTGGSEGKGSWKDSPAKSGWRSGCCCSTWTIINALVLISLLGGSLAIYETQVSSRPDRLEDAMDEAEEEGRGQRRRDEVAAARAARREKSASRGEEKNNNGGGNGGGEDEDGGGGGGGGRGGGGGGDGKGILEHIGTHLANAHATAKNLTGTAVNVAGKHLKNLFGGGGKNGGKDYADYNNADYNADYGESKSGSESAGRGGDDGSEGSEGSGGEGEEGGLPAHMIPKVPDHIRATAHCVQGEGCNKRGEGGKEGKEGEKGKGEGEEEVEKEDESAFDTLRKEKEAEEEEALYGKPRGDGDAEAPSEDGKTRKNNKEGRKEKSADNEEGDGGGGGGEGEGFFAKAKKHIGGLLSRVSGGEESKEGEEFDEPGGGDDAAGDSAAGASAPAGSGETEDERRARIEAEDQELRWGLYKLIIVDP
jgi:hypothetical protein